MMKASKDNILLSSSEPQMDVVLLNEHRMIGSRGLQQQIGKDIYLVHDPLPTNHSTTKVPAVTVPQEEMISTMASTTTSTTTTMQQYFELRKQQHILERSFTNAVTVPTKANAISFTLTPLATRITSTIEEALSNNYDDDDDAVHWKISSQRKKLRKPKKVVRFATNQNVTIPYNKLPIPIDGAVKVSRKAAMAQFWYTAQEYAQFRSDCNDVAAYAAGDVDYQQFFMNALFPYSCYTATTTIYNNSKSANTAATKTLSSQNIPLSPTDSDSDSTLSTCSSTTSPTDNDSCCTNSSHSTGSTAFFNDISTTTTTNNAETVELEMINKYRGLERLIFRHIVQDLKIDYIKRCVNEELNNCYFDIDVDAYMDDGEMDSSISMTDATKTCTTTTTTTTTPLANFRHYMYASQIMAQFFGQIDHIGVTKDNHEFILQQFNLLQRLQRQQQQKKTRSAVINGSSKRKSHGRDNYDSNGNFRQQTIEI